MRMLSPLIASVVTASLAAAAIALVPGDASASGKSTPPNSPQPAAAECWSVDGPHGRGTEVYFNAANNCPEPRHCRVWINAHEPPTQVHLDVGMKGRIDVGATEADDKFSWDCVPVSPGM